MSQHERSFLRVIQDTDCSLGLAAELEEALARLQTRRPPPVEKPEELPAFTKTKDSTGYQRKDQ